MKSKTVNIPIFPGQLLIIYSEDPEEVNKKFGWDDAGSYRAIAFRNLKQPFAPKFAVAFFPYSINRMNIIAHEAVHIANFICEYAGIKLDTDNDEAYAYILDWVVDQCDKFLNQFR